ncbi:unnamed protein product [Cuscuta campestris]|uniref:Uncharacterized protein n=1 Tax=Cuscuta campestris TaxID=132261 RepID=A0A484KA12_9ASTE|nr:unnamed protein product [Cuscuta campestris]
MNLLRDYLGFGNLVHCSVVGFLPLILVLFCSVLFFSILFLSGHCFCPVSADLDATAAATKMLLPPRETTAAGCGLPLLEIWAAW